MLQSVRKYRPAAPVGLAIWRSNPSIRYERQLTWEFERRQLNRFGWELMRNRVLVRQGRLSGTFTSRTLSLIGLIVAVVVLGLWASPSAAMVHFHSPPSHATVTQEASSHSADDCLEHGELGQTSCCGLACCPSLALLPAQAPLADSQPMVPAARRAALGASLTLDILPPPPKA